MRIWRHHDDEPARPAWVAGKPVWSVVHIEAPRSSELADASHDERPHAAA